MNLTALATDIASRVPAMAKDSPLNNATLIENLIRAELERITVRIDGDTISAAEAICHFDGFSIERKP